MANLPAAKRFKKKNGGTKMAAGFSLQSLRKGISFRRVVGANRLVCFTLWPYGFRGTQTQWARNFCVQKDAIEVSAGVPLMVNMSTCVTLVVMMIKHPRKLTSLAGKSTMSRWYFPMGKMGIFQCHLGGGFKYVLFSTLFGEDSHFD